MIINIKFINVKNIKVKNNLIKLFYILIYINLKIKCYKLNL